MVGMSGEAVETYKGYTLRIVDDPSRWITKGRLYKGQALIGTLVKIEGGSTEIRVDRIRLTLRNRADVDALRERNEVRARDLRQSRDLGAYVKAHPELRVACPFCKAVPLQKCRTRGDLREVSVPHQARRDRLTLS